MTRDFGREMDELHSQMAILQQLVQQLLAARTAGDYPSAVQAPLHETAETPKEAGAVFYSGHMEWSGEGFRWEPQERRLEQLLGVSSDRLVKVLAALGHKQRLDILCAVLIEPLTGAELVEQLRMGTTGQLYHHLKALTAANLLVQEQSGRYTVPKHGRLPFLLLLAAAGDLLDTGGYPDMAETRSNPGRYFGHAADYDVHHLLRAVIGNSVQEHEAGYCSKVGVFLHDDGSVTVSDNGRGIPVSALPDSSTPKVQAILTEIPRLDGSAPYHIPGAGQGISIAVVNALSERLEVEIRREGRVYRQSYRHGVPVTGLLTAGLSAESGTGITLKPDPEFFRTGFQRHRLQEYREELASAYPGLTVIID
ncbi:ATP-binding protein [Paenibacillus tepidiphilus]|uniref:ATP-binding protein n=1 Tax=Paenibacillus tepidiphilus TaxID=2608683 RepID=UPI00123AF940|nr:ATP-binding protein [Paenibacillus tepidiphilus]